MTQNSVCWFGSRNSDRTKTEPRTRISRISRINFDLSYSQTLIVPAFGCLPHSSVLIPKIFGDKVCKGDPYDLVLAARTNIGIVLRGRFSPTINRCGA